jgi:DNA-binding XRE family transcriptional regulator
MTVQFLKTDSGEELVVLSRRDYDALRARLGDEEAEDRMTLVVAAEARADAPLPEAVSAAVLRGEGLIRALRVWRGLTQVQVAESADIGQSYLSELETRSKAPSAETAAKLARALNVPAGWLV